MSRSRSLTLSPTLARSAPLAATDDGFGGAADLSALDDEDESRADGPTGMAVEPMAVAVGPVGVQGVGAEAGGGEGADARAPSGKRSRAGASVGAAKAGAAACGGAHGGGSRLGGGGGGGGGAGLASTDPLLASLLGRHATPPVAAPKGGRASGHEKASFTHYSLDGAEGGEAANRDALAAALQRTAQVTLTLTQTLAVTQTLALTLALTLNPKPEP